MRLQRLAEQYGLPALLLLLPFVMLGFRVSDDQSTLGTPQWRARMEAAANRLQQESSFEFWLQESLRRFNRSVQRKRDSGSWPTDADIRRARQAARVGVIPEGYCWMVVFPGGTGPGKPRLIEHGGLEAPNGVTIRNLLEQVFLANIGKESALRTKRWETTLKNLFGLFVTPDMFDSRMKGRAFPVVFESRHRWMAWDLVMSGDSSVPAFATAMMFEAPTQNVAEILIPTMLREWKSRDILPAFLSFPTEPSGARVRRFLHRRLGAQFCAPVLADIQKEMEIVLPEDRQKSQVGDLRLPYRYVGQNRLLGSAVSRVVPLNPFHGCIGVLVTRAPPVRETWVDELMRGYAILLATGVFLYGFRRWCLGRAPDLSVRGQLLIWLFGLVLAPWLLALAVGSQFLGDLKENLIDARSRDVEATLAHLDAGIGSLLSTSERACRKALEAPDLVDRLKRAQLEGQPADAILTEIVERADQAGLKLRSLTVMGHNGYRQHWVEPGVPREHSDLLLDFVEIGYGRRFHAFELPDPVFASQPYVLKVRTALARRAGSPTTLLNFESVDRFWAGDMAHSSYVWRGYSNAKVWFLVILVWDQAAENLRFLSQSLARENERQSQVRLGAYRQFENRWVPVMGSARHPEFERLAKRGAFARGHQIRGNWLNSQLIQTMPCLRLPSVKLLAASSLHDIWMRILREVLLIMALLIGSCGLVVGMAIRMARHVSDPIVRISSGLNRIAGGHLDLTLRDDTFRWDELGDALRELDTLTGKLRERRDLLSFVSPQVLENLSGGNLLELARGRSREATVLASDIRDFTTMTEMYEPRQVFALVNRHLQVMAEVIRRHGGVIDRFVGDAIFAVFYAEQKDDHVWSAVQAAEAMNGAHRAILQERSAAGLFGYRMGIGIETGRLLSGVLGDSETRLDFTVLGEIITRAAELENASKKGTGSHIVISDGVRACLSERVDCHPVSGEPGAWELDQAGGGLSERNCDATNPESPRLTTAASSTPPESEAADRPPAVPMLSPSRTHSSIEDNKPMALAIVLLMAISVGTAFLSWNERHRSSELGRVRQALQSAATLLHPERILVEQTRQALQIVAEPIAEGKPVDERLLEQLRLRLRTIYAAAPKWQVFLGLYSDQEPAPPVGPTFAMVGGSMRRLIDDHRSPDALQPFFSTQECEYMGFLAQAYHLDRYAERTDMMPDLARWKQQAFDLRGYKAKDYDDIFSRCMNNISWEVSTFQTVGMGCFPIYRTEQSDLDPADPASVSTELFDPERVRARLVQTRRQLKGMMLVFLDQKAASLEHLAPFMVDDYRKLGCELEIIEEGEPPTALCRNRLFHEDTELQSIIRQPSSPVHETRSWLVLEEVTTLKKSYRVMLAKARQSPFAFSALSGAAAVRRQGESDVASESREVAHTGGWQSLGYSFWVMFFAGFLPMFWVIDRTVRRFFDQEFLSLRHHLAGHFLLAIVPVLFLVWQMLERAGFESEERLNSRSRVHLQEQVQRLENSVDLFSGYAMTAFERELQGEAGVKIAEHLMRGDAERVPVASDCQGHLVSIYEHLTQRGLLPMHLDLLHPRSEAVRYPLGTAEKELQRGTLVQRYAWRDVFRRLVADRQGVSARMSDKDATEDLVLGSELDEFSRGVGIGLEPEILARFLLSPMFFSSWASGQQEVRAVAKRLLYKDLFPVAEVHLVWRSPAPEASVFSSWVPSSEVDEEGVRWLPLSRKDVQGRLVRPFLLRPHLYRGSLDRVRFVVRDMTPDQRNQAALAADSGRPLVNETGSGDDQILRYCSPLMSMSQYLMMAEYPLGKMIAKMRTAVHLQQWALLALMLLALILSRRAALRFLEPISALKQALRQVQKGDYTQRLPTGWGAEFGTMARSFNLMTGSAEEGRILGKFVSDSARAVVGSGKISESDRSGTQQQVTAMFVELAGFKAILKKRHPEWIVEKVNWYFETMSRIIRYRGGEIDKFIGDKILAVFRDDATAVGQTNHSRAAEAACDMRRTMQEQLRLLDLDLGIGMVNGPVLAGVMGAQAVRLEYTVIGDTVNLASRLADVAGRLPGGGIVVERAIVEALGHSGWTGTFEALPIRTVKGKKREVEVFRMLE